jgi:Protein of unknown function (DUF3761)
MSMNRNTLLLAAPLLALAWTLPVRADTSAAAPTTCKDGTTSAATGRGACSGHGGVQKTASTASPSSAAPAPAATPPAGSASAPTSPATTKPAAPSSTKPASGNTDPTGATAKCKDGTYSKSKSHSGACSHHGGVDQWLNAS